MLLQKETLIKIINDAETQMNLEALTDNIKFEDIGADSLDIMNILMGVQEEIHKELPDEDIDQLQSIEDILNYVNK